VRHAAGGYPCTGDHRPNLKDEPVAVRGRGSSPTPLPACRTSLTARPHACATTLHLSAHTRAASRAHRPKGNSISLSCSWRFAEAAPLLELVPRWRSHLLRRCHGPRHLSHLAACHRRRLDVPVLCGVLFRGQAEHRLVSAETVTSPRGGKQFSSGTSDRLSIRVRRRPSLALSRGRKD
jgi:hypothetical protein